MPKPVRRPTPRLRGALFALLALIAAPLAARAAAPSTPTPTPTRLTGTVAAVKGDRLTVKAADGRIVRIALAKHASILVVTPAKLSDIKPGRFVGTAAAPDGDQWRAIEVHIFPKGSHLGEGHRPWPPQPGATMTNADVTAAVVRAGSGRLTLATGGHRYTIEVPRGVPVFAMHRGTRKLVAKGAAVSFYRLKPENGVLTADGVTVSKDPRWPPK